MEYLQEQLRRPLHGDLLGISPAIEEVRRLITQVAPSDLTVLITGETGTGKDLAARMLHHNSERKNKPFIKVNCPAIQENLFESELFGHEKGAYTGAVSSSPGWLESAHEGTLFLDEITEAAPSVNSKLLMALDNEPFMRVGGVAPIHAQVRFVAATNVPVEQLVGPGRLSEEAMFRLAEVVIHLTPLRERPEDIALLAEHFNYNLCLQYERPYQPIPIMTLKTMESMVWSGNVRELSARIKEYLVTGTLDVLTQPLPVSMIPFAVNEPSATPKNGSNGKNGKKLAPLKLAVQQAVEKTERSLILEALEYTLWNRRKAAKMLEISYSSLLRRIDAYGIGKN